MGIVLKTFDLTKTYRQTRAVDNACMTVSEGDIYGFVGENGSGKTTIIRLISGLIFADSGSYELFGVKSTDPKIVEARRKIGAIVESPSIYPNMTAIDNVKLQSKLLGVDGDEQFYKDALKEVGLDADVLGKKKAGDFSLGMRQRLAIAMALVGKPQFIMLDEPMNGLDPAGIVEIRELILKLNRENKITFLISSHILTELALVATKYGIISKGRIVEEITAKQLHEKCGKYVIVKTDNNQKLIELVSVLKGAIAIEDGDSVKISGDVQLTELLKVISNSDLNVEKVNCEETSFEQYYLSIIGGKK
ncbi:MAG: ATP-binding cassette domain-containing protein [Clostridia bacterium]|nr:ATP-binding cassette domain-containing protein [Clostridia bacterium]